MATQVHSHTHFDALPMLPKTIELNEHHLIEKTGIMFFFKSIFKKQKQIAPIVVDVIDQELLYKISCEKLSRRSFPLLGKTLIVNAMRSNLRKVPASTKKVKRSTPPLKVKVSDDDDVPLGMLKL
jgi:hypothetical protein